MAVNANHPSFFNGTSPISFRALQQSFGGNFNKVKFSTYKRDTSLNNANPIVPDATENADIKTTNDFIQASHYRGSIKNYILTQTGTDVNLTFHQNAYSASTHHWNSNLNKNVIKIFQVKGTVVSGSTTPALKFNGSAYNLSADLDGTVAGKRGIGQPQDLNGEPGGDAFYFYTNANKSFNTATFHARIKGKVIGGGGGGGGGRAGNPSEGSCGFNSNNTVNSNRSGETGNTICANTRCPSQANSGNGIVGNLSSEGSCRKRGKISPNRDRRRRRRGGWLGIGRKNRNRNRKDQAGGGCRTNRANDCWSDAEKNCTYSHNYTITASGGGGGTGGNGYGYDSSNGQIHNKNAGAGGNTGTNTPCAFGGTGSVSGGKGTKGGGGGQKGEAGGAGSNKGGAPGHSIKGRRISFNGSSGSNYYGPLKDLS